MLAWRLCQEPFADLTGQGARLYGGRWNSRGRPMVYMASTAALALLEVRVHLDLPPELLPDDYVLVTIDLDALAVEVVDEVPDHPDVFGDIWLQARRTPILQVPSTIIPESCNLLLNPGHRAAVSAGVASRRHFEFDRRLWLSAVSLDPVERRLQTFPELPP